MKTKTLLLSMLFVLAASSTLVEAQQRAVTRDGREVILYKDGTWEYAGRFSQPGVDIRDEGTGRSLNMVLDEEVGFVIVDGLLEDFRVFVGGFRLYNEMDGKLKQIGPFEIKYEAFSDKLKQVGPYELKYEAFSDRVKQIGPHRIEYDFATGKVSRVGNTYLKYSFFNGKLTSVQGSTPGLRVSVF